MLCLLVKKNVLLYWIKNEYITVPFTFPKEDMPFISTKKTVNQQSIRQRTSCHTGLPISSIPSDICNTSWLKRNGYEDNKKYSLIDMIFHLTWEYSLFLQNDYSCCNDLNITFQQSSTILNHKNAKQNTGCVQDI